MVVLSLPERVVSHPVCVSKLPSLSNRGECAHLLRDLDATADLPPHCSLLALLLLDLTYRWWSESEGPDIEEGDVFASAAAAKIGIKLHSARYPDPAPFLRADPQPRQPARSLTDLRTALAATIGRRQPHNVPPLHTAQVVHEVVTEEYRILDSLNYELTAFMAADWVRLFENRFSLNVEHLRQRFPQKTGSWLSLLARVPSEALADPALLLARDFVRDRSLSMESTPSRIGSTAWFLSFFGLGQPLAVGWSLKVKPRWLGSPPSTRVLLLFPRLLSLASCQGV